MPELNFDRPMKEAEMGYFAKNMVSKLSICEYLRHNSDYVILIN